MSLSMDPNHVFRDGPSGSPHHPIKWEVRRLLNEFRQAITALIAGQGGDIDLPNLLISYSITGGTENDIIAEANLPAPSGAGEALFSIGIAQPNTGSVTINGKPLLTNSGNQIAAGGLVADGIYLFLDDGTNYRLLSDYASAAIQAAAEAAADRSEAYAAMLSVDKIKFKTVPMLLSDTMMSYTPGPGLVEVGAGDVIEAQGYRYEVAASGASDHHVEAAGGVKLYVLPGEGGFAAEAFGAVEGEGLSAGQLTSNSAALNKWISALLETRIAGAIGSGVYEIDGAINFPETPREDARLIMDCPSGQAVLRYMGSSRINRVVSVYGSIHFARLTGLTFDGQNKANGGMSIFSTYGKARMFARDCHAANLKVASSDIVNANGMGLRLAIASEATDYGGRAQMNACSVTTMTKDTQLPAPNSNAAQGIVVTGFEQAFVQGNRVETILTDDTVKIDADGIVIFSRSVEGVYQPMCGEVSGNILKNCAGRFVKLQVDGDLHVHHNALELHGPIELITSFRAIDSQTGSCTIEDNTLYADDQWTGGSESAFVSAQSPQSQPSLFGRTIVGIRRNKLYTSKMLGELVRPVLYNQDDFSEWLIEDNEAYWAGSGDAAAVNIVSSIRYTGATKKYALRYRRNNVAANNFILQTATSGSGDKSGIMALDVEGNTNRYGANFIFATSSNCWTSDMMVRGNRVGAGGGNRVQQSEIDLAKLRAGCAFVAGTATIISGPSSNLANNAIEKIDNQTIRNWSASALRHSIDNGATWRAVALS